MTHLSTLFTFDVMGDVAFGTDFDGVASGNTHSAVKTMRMGLKPLAFFWPVPWLWHLLMAIPGALKPWTQLNAWARGELHNRLKV